MGRFVRIFAGMHRTKALVSLAVATASLVAQPICAQMQYPPTRKSDHVDTYFGTKVADPYHWLEDDRSAETTEWVQTQNGLTFDYLEKIPFRNTLFERLEQLYNYERFGVPTRLGKTLFYYRNDGLQNQSVLYRQDGAAAPTVFIDPNTLSKEGTVTVNLAGASDDNKYLAFAVAKAGSDWNDLIFFEAATGKQMADTLHWVKFSGASFYRDGVFYSRYDAPTGSALSAKNEFQKVYFHKFGTPQSQDELIYEDKKHPLRYFSAGVTEDNQYLVLNVSEGTSGNEVYVRNLATGQQDWTKLCPGFAYDYDVVTTEGSRIIVKTNNGAANYRLVSIDPKAAEPKNWANVLAEKPDMVLEAVVPIGQTYLVNYLKDVTSNLFAMNLKTRASKKVQLPGLGTVSGLSARRKDGSAFFAFTSFMTPTSVYEVMPDGAIKLFKKPAVNFPVDQYEVNQVFYASKDGTRVPMFLVHKKGLEKDGARPTLLYGYGGFNISVQPSFNPQWLPLLENGGVLAIANIRGGGEYGEKWHKAGMLLKKQNVFDDFIAAAQYLQTEKYTDKEHLAIEGRSNGGLLVGACMTQRPELFKVAFPGVGVLDMLRYQKFTIGWGWAVEYGASDSAKYFKYLKGYSPLHNLKPAAYPATMVVTGDHDDRVVPAHSFKFAATLQEMQRGKNPTLIRIETNAGHGAGKPIKKVLQERADMYAFMFNVMGYTDLPMEKK